MSFVRWALVVVIVVASGLWWMQIVEARRQHRAVRQGLQAKWMRDPSRAEVEQAIEWFSWHLTRRRSDEVCPHKSPDDLQREWLSKQRGES